MQKKSGCGCGKMPDVLKNQLLAKKRISQYPITPKKAEEQTQIILLSKVEKKTKVLIEQLDNQEKVEGPMTKSLPQSKNTKSWAEKLKNAILTFWK